jgi:uncharacterized repeat protein (TIGR03803 family)
MKYLHTHFHIATESLRELGWTMAATLLLLFVIPSATAQTFTTLYTFTGSDGAFPSSLTIDAAGNLYGTALNGGDLNCGGGFGCGVVFEVNASGQFSLLHTFTGIPDGELPDQWGALLRTAAGILFGETSAGGANGFGMIYSLNPLTGKEKILYSFTSIAGGFYPSGGVIRDSAGDFYGTTEFGGDTACNQGSGCGTVFKLSNTGAFTTLYSFTGSPDGIQPHSGVVRDSAGNLYGTNVYGGAQCPDSIGCGTVFEIDSSGNETIVHTFSGGSDGGLPFAGLIRDGKGNLYGTADAYGSRGNGVVFRINPAASETVLYNFSGTDGSSPRGRLVADSAGNLYGTTAYGGTGTCTYGCGTVFQLDRQGHETVLYNFTGGADGSLPLSILVRDAAGNLYGTTGYGGDSSCSVNSSGCGTVFKLTP